MKKRIANGPIGYGDVNNYDEGLTFDLCTSPIPVKGCQILRILGLHCSLNSECSLARHT